MKKTISFIFSILIFLSGLLHGTISYAVEDPLVIVPVKAVFEGTYNVIIREADELSVNMGLNNTVSEVETLTLNDTDRQKLMQNDNLTTYIDVKDMKYESVKSILEQTGKINGRENKFTFDLSISVHDSKDGTTRDVTEIEEPLTFSFLAPKDFNEQSVKDAKMFNVHQISEDSYQVKILPITYDKAQKRISFSTRTFSAYVLSYKVQESTPVSTPNNTPSASEESSPPQSSSSNDIPPVFNIPKQIENTDPIPEPIDDQSIIGTDSTVRTSNTVISDIPSPIEEDTNVTRPAKEPVRFVSIDPPEDEITVYLDDKKVPDNKNDIVTKRIIIAGSAAAFVLLTVCLVKLILSKRK